MTTTQQVLTNLVNKCEIYFEDSLISKEWILKKYAEFFVSSLSDVDRSVSIALHTGSICFDAIACTVAAIACILLDKTDADTIVASFKIGDMIQYWHPNPKNRRICQWGGKYEENGVMYIKLIEDGKSSGGLTYEDRKHFLMPYYGNSEKIGGKKMEITQDNRTNFISDMFGYDDARRVPRITKTSVVIVAERDVFKRIAKGLQIRYGNKEKKEIGLLDLVTASYYSSEDKTYPFSVNVAMNDPVLKVTKSVSTARMLVCDNKANNVVGFMVINPNAVEKGGGELSDVLHRKSLKFIHVASAIDTNGTEEIVNDVVSEQGNVGVFACTKEFLRLNASLIEPERYNQLINELHRQIDKIVNNSVTEFHVNGGCSLEQYKKVKETLCKLRKSEWSDDLKNRFIISAHSLLKLFTNAVFPMRKLEEAISNNIVNCGSPKIRLGELRELAERAGDLSPTCESIVDVLDEMYKNIFDNCPKYVEFRSQLSDSDVYRTMVVVPNKFYSDILTKDEELKDCGVTVVTAITDDKELDDFDATFVTENQSNDSEYYDWIIPDNSAGVVTANRFDGSKDYDRIIVVGHFSGKRFESQKSKAAADIRVLLYDCEWPSFKHSMHEAEKFERELNLRQGILEPTITAADSRVIDDDTSSVEKEYVELEEFIEKESWLGGINEYSIKDDGISGSASKAEVYAVGRFPDGRKMLFSEYYKALVFDEQNSQINEKDVKDLVSGDVLVLHNRDNYTRNTVDYIYNSLLKTGKFGFGNEALEATRKAAHWKKVMREYQCMRNYSYKELTKKLCECGSTLQDVTIRQWLAKESHVVGPKEEKTLKHIAQLTNDTELLKDATGYYHACRLVRMGRRRIRKWMGEAIVDKLEGKKPPEGSELEIVFNNVEKHCETLELESFTVLDESKTVNVPTSLINKPLDE